jgi:hypothetical protein
MEEVGTPVTHHPIHPFLPDTPSLRMEGTNFRKLPPIAALSASGGFLCRGLLRLFQASCFLIVASCHS